MENRKSYADHKKNQVLDLSATEVNFVLDVYIQMIIDEALFNYKKDLLQKQINDALDAKDKNQFYNLTEKYNKLLNIQN